MSTFDRSPFNTARRDLRDIISVQVTSYLAVPAARRTVWTYQPLVELPVDPASLGFLVTITQAGCAWSIF
jgi:hypothetical protein